MGLSRRFLRGWVCRRVSGSGHEDGDVVGRAGGQCGQQGVAGLGDWQVAGGLEGAGRACRSGVQAGGGIFDGPVGVQDRGGVAGDVDAGGLVVPAAGEVGAQRQAGGQVEEGGGVAGAGQGGLGVPGRGQVPVSGGGVVDGVDAGGAGLVVGQVGGELIEAGGGLCGGQGEGGGGGGGGGAAAPPSGGAPGASRTPPPRHG